jgi:putative ubiquitin-RnfH superfamily antitoxin RatB of RatAB toxin-antitoxin module
VVRVEVVQAWPHRFVAVPLALPEGATLADAVAASGLPLDEVAGYALHGARAEPGARLRDGDRVELLRPLAADPKEARRRRATTSWRRG